MITIDTNSIYQSRYYNVLNTKRTNTNAYQSIDEYQQAYAAKGTPEVNNPNDVNNTKEVNYEETIKELNLENPKNRFAVLSQLTHADLIMLIGSLDKNKMLLGLKFFTKEKLLRMIYHLPKEELLKMLFQIYSKEELLSMLPMKELMKFMSSKKIQPRDLIKVMQSLPRSQLAQILESITGQVQGHKPANELLSQLQGMKQTRLTEGIKGLPYSQLLSFVSQLTSNNNDLFNEFSKDALFGAVARMPKGSMIDSMIAIRPEFIMGMLGQLPNNILSQVALLVEPDKLIANLMKFHTDLLANLSF